MATQGLARRTRARQERVRAGLPRKCAPLGVGPLPQASGPPLDLNAPRDLRRLYLWYYFGVRICIGMEKSKS